MQAESQHAAFTPDDAVSQTAPGRLWMMLPIILVLEVPCTAYEACCSVRYHTAWHEMELAGQPADLRPGGAGRDRNSVAHCQVVHQGALAHAGSLADDLQLQGRRMAIGLGAGGCNITLLPCGGQAVPHIRWTHSQSPLKLSSVAVSCKRAGDVDSSGL